MSNIGLLLKPYWGDLMGASLMGKGMALFATGITTVQCYEYFAFHSSREKLPLKSFVALFFLLSILSAIFHLMNMYSIYITGFGDYLQASEVDWARRFDIFTVTFSAFCGQLFFLKRAYSLSKNKLLTIIILVLVFFTYGAALRSCAIIWAGDAGTSPDIGIWTEVSSWPGVAADTLICGMFMWYMHRPAKEVQGFRKSTDSVLQRLLTMTLSTTLLTTSITVCLAILTRIQDKTVLWSEAPLPLIPPAYLASITFVLNSRDGLRNMANQSLIQPSINLNGPSTACSCGKSMVSNQASTRGQTSGGRFPPFVLNHKAGRNPSLQVDLNSTKERPDVEKGSSDFLGNPITEPVQSFH